MSLPLKPRRYINKYPKSQKLDGFWFCKLGVSFVVRPYTLKMWIFDWGGHLHRIRTDSEKLGNEKLSIYLLREFAFFAL
jgi:hypothetical protein